LFRLKMSGSSSIVFVGVAPHPPIMVPEVGREAISEVRGSLDAMRALTERINASGAQTLVLISPHAPLAPRAFVAYDEPVLHGDFANFRAPAATVSAPLDAELLDAIEAAASKDGFQLLRLGHGHELDHGTAVPLYFFLRHGWRGRVVALGYTFLDNEAHVRFGASVARAAHRLGRAVAFVASGDLSHRLKPGAPAGYQPEAHLFDEEIVAAVNDAALERIVNVDQNLRRLAGECGYRSLLVAVGAAGELTPAAEVLHYEAPFGVGYMVAQLARGASANGTD
jgi:AmmeMemoRadiSam system protein B